MELPRAYRIGRSLRGVGVIKADISFSIPVHWRNRRRGGNDAPLLGHLFCYEPLKHLQACIASVHGPFDLARSLTNGSTV